VGGVVVVVVRARGCLGESERRWRVALKIRSVLLRQKMLEIIYQRYLDSGGTMVDGCRVLSRSWSFRGWPRRFWVFSFVAMLGSTVWNRGLVSIRWNKRK
jgi:hypothetical protein